MLFTIILFFLSISIAFALIAHKVWQLRTGKIVLDSQEKADWHDLSIESIRQRLLEIMKFAVHHTVLIALKTWIVTTNWIKRADAKVKVRLTHMIHKNASLPEGGKPSGYLKDIRSHKDEVTSAIEKEGSEE